MKKFLLGTVLMLTVLGLILAIGCTSPSAKAQKLFNDGKYEEVIAQYAADPNMSAIVTQAKEKLAEKMVAEGKYAAVLEMYPETAAAKEAKNKLAEQLFLAKNYAEVIAKYPETTWAAQAKIELEKAAAVQPPQTGKDGAKKPADTGMSEKEKAAQAELDKIMAIKMKNLRMKALGEFVAKPDYAGTKAVAAAKKELGQ